MKNQRVFVPGVGAGMCIEHVSHRCLVETKHSLAWHDEDVVMLADAGGKP